MTNHVAHLIQIGVILKEHGKTDFQLNRAVLKSEGSRGIKNSSRASTLLNLFLRFLNNEQIERKKWFFRSIEAYYIGYKGLYR